MYLTLLIPDGAGGAVTVLPGAAGRPGAAMDAGNGQRAAPEPSSPGPPDRPAYPGYAGRGGVPVWTAADGPTPETRRVKGDPVVTPDVSSRRPLRSAPVPPVEMTWHPATSRDEQTTAS